MWEKISPFTLNIACDVKWIYWDETIKISRVQQLSRNYPSNTTLRKVRKDIRAIGAKIRIKLPA